MKHFKETVVVLLVLVVLLLGAFVVISAHDKNSYRKMDYYGDDMRDSYDDYSVRVKLAMKLIDSAIRDYNIDKESTLSGIRGDTYIYNDLYVFAVKGEYIVGHPYRKDLENTKVTELKDVNDYYFGKDIVTTTEDGKWINYVFTIPETDKQAPKSTYCRKVEEHILCAGYYQAD